MAKLNGLKITGEPLVTPLINNEQAVPANTSSSKSQSPFLRETDIAGNNPIYGDNNNSILEDSFLPFITLKRNGDFDIDFCELIDFLNDRGYYKYELGKDFIIVKEKDNIVEEIQLHHLKDFINDLIETSEEVDFVIENENKIFQKGKLAFLPTLSQIKTFDDANNAHFFFNNGFVVVTKNNETELHHYGFLDDYIWKTQVLNRNIELIQDESLLAEGDFYKLLMNVCKNERPRFDSLISSMGYLLHAYSDPANTKAIIYADEKIPLISDEANGGTGKSLVGKAISRFKPNTCEMDGQTMNFSQTFVFQRMNQDTQIVFINDAQKNFDFEKLFSSITEGFIVQKKFQKEFIVKGPKVLITTNYTIKNDGDSFYRRKFEVEFSDHYSSSHTPIDEFGHRLFDQWDDRQWLLFDNLMLYAVKFYLDNGLIEADPINIEYRRLIDSSSVDFYNFIQKGYIKPYKEYSHNEVFMKFKFFIGDHAFSKNRFTRWLGKLEKQFDWIRKERPLTGNIDYVFWFVEKNGGHKPVEKYEPPKPKDLICIRGCD